MLYKLRRIFVQNTELLLPDVLPLTAVKPQHLISKPEGRARQC